MVALQVVEVLRVSVHWLHNLLAFATIIHKLLQKNFPCYAVTLMLLMMMEVIILFVCYLHYKGEVDWWS